MKSHKHKNIENTNLNAQKTNELSNSKMVYMKWRQLMIALSMSIGVQWDHFWEHNDLFYHGQPQPPLLDSQRISLASLEQMDWVHRSTPSQHPTHLQQPYCEELHKPSKCLRYASHATSYLQNSNSKVHVFLDCFLHVGILRSFVSLRLACVWFSQKWSRLGSCQP